MQVPSHCMSPPSCWTELFSAAGTGAPKASPPSQSKTQESQWYTTIMKIPPGNTYTQIGQDFTDYPISVLLCYNSYSVVYKLYMTYRIQFNLFLRISLKNRENFIRFLIKSLIGKSLKTTNKKLLDHIAITLGKRKPEQEAWELQQDTEFT